MNEDVVYRGSTQYRFWSFTPAKLQELRKQSNSLAAENIKALARRRKAGEPDNGITPSASDADVEGKVKERHGSNGAANAASDGQQEVECLNVKEEVELLNFYCKNLLDLGTDEFKYSLQVTATAIQYLKRFYLTHSLMDYAPKKIMPCALFLASKTENAHNGLDRFVETAQKIVGLEELTRDSVLGPEFIFTQALRFHFDVKHPFRALKGFWLECTILIGIAKGQSSPAEWSTRKSTAEIKDIFLKDSSSTAQFEQRLNNGYARTKEILQDAALLSDTYFFYTPSQIVFGAWHVHDAPFIKDFLDLRLTGLVPAKAKFKILDTVAECAQLLQGFSILEGAELKGMNRKMNRCNKLNAKDIMEESRARKRGATAAALDDGGGGGGAGGGGGQVEEDEAAAAKRKKRRLEREKAEKEGNDLFGPSLVKPA